MHGGFFYNNQSVFIHIFDLLYQSFYPFTPLLLLLPALDNVARIILLDLSVAVNFDANLRPVLKKKTR